MRKRSIKLMIMLAALTAAGIIYFIFAEHGHSLPCVFYELTGFYCPGCGSTRFARRLLNFDIPGAFKSNPAVFLTAPLLSAVIIRRIYYYIRYGYTPKSKWLEILCYIFAALLVLFGVVRNLPGFEFLTPQ